MLAINNLSVQINRRRILQKISFEIESGDFLVLLGGNGAGKSTLLKAIAKSLPIASGNIEFFGKSLTNYAPAELSMKRAVLSQNVSLVFPMKVLDVVLLGRYPYYQKRGISPKDRAIAYQCLDRMGMVDFAEKDVLNLSGGEGQRVHLARVLAQVWGHAPDNPLLLLLDEPTSNLDIAYQHILLKFLQEEVKNNSLAILTILHDMNLAARYANKIALLKKGQLLTIGTAQETLTSNWIHQTFGVSSIVQKDTQFDCVQVSTY